MGKPNTAITFYFAFSMHKVTFLIIIFIIINNIVNLKAMQGNVHMFLYLAVFGVVESPPSEFEVSPLPSLEGAGLF